MRNSKYRKVYLDEKAKAEPKIDAKPEAKSKTPTETGQVSEERHGATRKAVNAKQ
jgi:hypothetical protein